MAARGNFWSSMGLNPPLLGFAALVQPPLVYALGVSNAQRYGWNPPPVVGLLRFCEALRMRRCQETAVLQRIRGFHRYRARAALAGGPGRL